MPRARYAGKCSRNQASVSSITSVKAGVHIDLVVAVTLEHDQLLRLAGPVVKRLRLFRRHQPVVVGGDEEHRTGRDPVHDPFRVEAQRLIDIFERQRVESGGDIAPRGGRQLRRLAVRQQHLAALDPLRLALRRALHAVPGRPLQQVEPLVRPAHAAHPALAVPDPDHADDAFHPPVHRAGPDHRGASVAGAVDAEPRLVHLRLRAEESQRRLHVRHPAVGRQARARPLALAPALVVEGQHDIARFGEHAGIVRQIEVLHPSIAVAEHDARPPLSRREAVRPVQVPYQLEPFGIEGDGCRAHGDAPPASG